MRARPTPIITDLYRHSTAEPRDPLLRDDDDDEAPDLTGFECAAEWFETDAWTAQQSPPPELQDD